MTIHLNKFHLPSPKDVLSPVWLKFDLVELKSSHNFSILSFINYSTKIAYLQLLFGTNDNRVVIALGFLGSSMLDF